MSEPLLAVEDLRTHFVTDEGVVRAVDGVSFEVRSGETLALVGESGSGKTVTALSILRLVPEPPARVSGRLLFRGRDLRALAPEELRRVRGGGIAMVFQEPATSLDPVFPCGDQIAEVVRAHERASRREARARAIEMLRLAGIPDAERRAREYPHQLSGGLRQRVMIAMALVCRPSLLIADEPTTALDVTIQAQILERLDRLRAELGMAVLLITHDLGVVAGAADRVAVMYAGRIVEWGSVDAIFHRPRHPYTAGLLASLPRLEGRGAPLRVIPGQVPDAARPPAGCRFHPRCPAALEACRTQEPPRAALEAGGEAFCWRSGEIAAGTLDPVSGEEKVRG
ncbi:MAG TPA: ABC transporter ATP-binding protein [Terriglobales bacterium]|nr:ABC transporter ATP-binding protein [Terriglobales bacterium]